MKALAGYSKELHFDWTKATVPTSLKLRRTTWLGVENEHTAKHHPDRIRQVVSYLSKQGDHSCFFIYFARSLVQNSSLQKTNDASYGIQSCNFCKKIRCKGCRGSLGGQPQRHPAVATLQGHPCLDLVWVAAIPSYMQQTAPPARACVVIPIYSLLLFSCFGGKTGISQLCFPASKKKIRHSIITLSI